MLRTRLAKVAGNRKRGTGAKRPAAKPHRTTVQAAAGKAVCKARQNP